MARQSLQVGRADDSHLKSSQCVAVSSPLGRHCVARVKSVEASVVGNARQSRNCVSAALATLLSVTRRGVPSVVATGVAEPFGNRSWGKPPRPRCLTTVLSPQRAALPLREVIHPGYLNLANLLTEHPLLPSHSPRDASIPSVLSQSSSLAASHAANSSSSSLDICISKGVSNATIS